MWRDHEESQITQVGECIIFLLMEQKWGGREMDRCERPSGHCLIFRREV